MKPMYPIHYEIRVEGCLMEQWAEWFEGLTITQQNGEMLLSGPLSDQAELFGLLKKVRDLGMVLVSVNQKPIDSLIEGEKNHESNCPK